MSEFLESAKRARILMPHMYGINKNYLKNMKLQSEFKNNYNTVIKFLEGSKRSWPKESYNVRYYNWYNSNKVKNAVKALEKIGVPKSIVSSLKSDLKRSENIMKKAFENKLRKNAALKIQRAYKKIFKTNRVPKNLGNVVITHPMARSIMSKRFKTLAS